jgi:hypothetical protein
VAGPAGPTARLGIGPPRSTGVRKGSSNGRRGLAPYLVWHLRQAWAPLTFTDEHRPDPADPVAPARRSPGADAKAATKTTTEDLPVTSFTACSATSAH